MSMDSRPSGSGGVRFIGEESDADASANDEALRPTGRTMSADRSTRKLATGYAGSSVSSGGPLEEGIAEGEGSFSSGTAKGIFGSKLKSKFEEALNNSRIPRGPSKRIPHHFGRKVSAPLKAIFTGGRNGVEGERVSALSDSFMDSDNDHFSRSSILEGLDAKTERMREVSTDQSSGQNQDDMMKEVERLMNRASAIYSENERNRESQDNATRQIDRSNSLEKNQEDMMEQEQIEGVMNRGSAMCSINEKIQDNTMKEVEQVMSQGSAMYSMNEGDARSTVVPVVMAAGVSISAGDQRKQLLEVREKMEVDRFDNKTSTSCTTQADEQFQVRIRAETAAKHSPLVENKAAVLDHFQYRIRAKMRQGNPCNAATRPNMPVDITAKSPAQTKNLSTVETSSNQYQDRIRAKMEQGDRKYTTLNSTQPTNNTTTAHEQFENRLRDKLSEGNTGAAKHKLPVRANREQGRDSGATAMKSILSLENMATANNQKRMQDSDNSCRFHNRLHAEVELGNAGNTWTKRPPSAENTPTPEDRFESRLRAKAKQGHGCNNGVEETHLLDSRIRAKMDQDSSSNSTPKVYSRKGGLKGLAGASEHFEDRLKAKMAQGNTKDVLGSHPTNENIDAASNQYEQRKTMNADLANHRICSKKISLASDRFENRLKEKMERDKTKTTGKEQTKKNSASVHRRIDSELAPASSERFNARIKAKLEKGKKSSTPMKTSTPEEILSSALGSEHSSSAEDQFESRLMTKIGKGNKIDSAVMKKRPEPGTPLDRLDMRLRAKMERITKLAEEGEYNVILKILGDNPCLPASIVTLALEKISESFSLVAMDSPIGDRREIMTLADNWVKVLAAIMSNHSTDETLQVVGLCTIWIIMAHNNSRYTWDFISSGLELLTNAMRTHRNAKKVQECGCGIVSLLSFSRDQASYLLSFNDGSIVDRLCEALYSNIPSALSALFKLFVVPDQPKSSSENLLETIGHCSNRERQGDGLTNAMDTVLGIMSACPRDCEVQMWGSYLLWALLSHERLLNCRQNSLCSLISNILRHLEATTTAPDASLVVHGSAICLLSRMSDTRRSLLMGMDEIFSRIVVRIMMAQSKSRVVALHGCHCISNTSCIEEDSISAILGVMKDFHDEEVADIAINSIFLLTGKEYQTVLTLLKDESLIGSIVETMSRHPNSPSIQIAACNILSSIALDRHVIRDICSCGGANRIISNLYNLSQEHLAVCKSFVALSNILGVCDAAILQESRAPKCVLRAMEANPKDINIQIRGATIIWNLASFHSSLKRDIIHFEGIRIISQSMSSFIASEHMQEKGVLVLWTLSVPQPLNSVMTMCSIEAIGNAIAAHLPCAKICEHGLGALSTLASSKSMVQDIDNLIDLIFSSMWMHSNSATVQQGALASLSKISVDQSTNQVLQITPDDIDVLINAMRTHLYVKGVQENAIILLRSFTFCPTNLHLLGQNPFLVGLVKSAMSKFHGSIRVNMEDLLRLLPTDAQ